MKQKYNKQIANAVKSFGKPKRSKEMFWQVNSLILFLIC